MQAYSVSTHLNHHTQILRTKYLVDLHSSSGVCCGCRHPALHLFSHFSLPCQSYSDLHNPNLAFSTSLNFTLAMKQISIIHHIRYKSIPCTCQARPTDSVTAQDHLCEAEITPPGSYVHVPALNTSFTIWQIPTHIRSTSYARVTA